MTREEAINHLKTVAKSAIDSGYDGAVVDAVDMAIKAIEQQPCEDCISKQAVLDIFGDVMDYWKEHAIDVEPHEIKDALIEQYEFTAKQLSELPPVTPQLKTGHWSRKTKVDAYDIAGVKIWGIKCQCDRCDFTTIVVEDFGYYKYCPNCGAKMFEPQESEVQNANSD